MFDRDNVVRERAAYGAMRLALLLSTSRAWLHTARKWAFGAAVLLAAPHGIHAATGGSSAADTTDAVTPGEPGRPLCAGLPAEALRVRFQGKRFDLRKPQDLRRLAGALDEKTRSRDTRGAPEDAPDPPSKEESESSKRRALLAMRSLASRALTTEPVPCDALVDLAEIGDSLELDAKRPVPKRLDIVQVPSYYLNLVHNSVGKPSASGPGQLDPVSSTFWSRPGNIAGIDVYHEFGPILRMGTEPCRYDEPKTSYGTTPGFSIECGERTIKVKFGAVKLGRDPQAKDSEVAVTRLFGAVGFHVEPNDYAPEIRLRYDRRIFLEFNSRKDLGMTITVLGFIPIYHVKVQGIADPFSFTRSAVMKNGDVLSPDALAARLIRRDVLERSSSASRKSPRGTLLSHYREDAAAFEADVDYLVMQEANVQVRDSGGRNIGPWGWDRLDHTRRRELRGAALMAAWTNYFDARWDNNRLKIAEDVPGEGVILRHCISDLGSGLGRAENFRVVEGNRVNDFPWTFTEGPVKDRKGRETRPFRIVGYKPVFPNDAFREMTVDDARWMARLIGQLTENQIVQALIASGFGSAEVRLYTEKLVSRRDRMIQDLGLADEIALLRPGGSVRSLDYDPLRDGPVRATGGDGSVLTPLSTSDLVIRRGVVVPR